MIFKRGLVFFWLCLLNSPAFTAQNKVIKDDLGSSFRLSSPPQRIISLAPNITEILFALGLEEKIVGVTRYCDYPAGAFKKEKIGGLIDPNLEKIKALDPDLIIGFRGNPLRILQRLKSLRLPIFVIEAGENLESLYLTIEKIGLVTQKEREADNLATSLRKRYEQIEASLEPVLHKPKVFLLLYGMGLWTCGKNSFLNDLLIKAKGVNVSGEIPKKWLHLNREQLIHQDPEVVIIMTKSQEEFYKAKEWLKKESHLDKIQAIQKEKIYFLDENLASRFGPRLLDALYQIALILHSHLFAQRP